MTDQTNTKPTVNSSTTSAIISAIVASYLMTQFSLAGVNFETLGVSSELVKSTSIGVLVGFFAWLTPNNIVISLRNVIIFVRTAKESLTKAAEEDH